MSDRFEVPEPSVKAMDAFYATFGTARTGVVAAMQVDVPAIVRREVAKCVEFLSGYRSGVEWRDTLAIAHSKYAASRFGPVGDGITDDTDAVQRAAGARFGETPEHHQPLPGPCTCKGLKHRPDCPLAPTPSAPAEPKSHLDKGNVVWRKPPAHLAGTVWMDCPICLTDIQINAADLAEGLRVAAPPSEAPATCPTPEQCLPLGCRAIHPCPEAARKCMATGCQNTIPATLELCERHSLRGVAAARPEPKWHPEHPGPRCALCPPACTACGCQQCQDDRIWVRTQRDAPYPKVIG